MQIYPANRFRYVCMILVPKHIEIKIPADRNGPNGTGVFLLLFLTICSGNMITIPRTEAMPSATSMFCQPRIKPQTAVSLMSPPPIPPLLSMAMTKNRSDTEKKPMMFLSIIPSPQKYALRFHRIPTTKIKRFKPSGISLVSQSMIDRVKRAVETASETGRNQVGPKTYAQTSQRKPLSSSTAG